MVYLGASELHVAKPDPLTLAGEGVGRRLLAVNGADRGHDLRVRERANLGLGLGRQPVAGQTSRWPAAAHHAACVFSAAAFVRIVARPRDLGGAAITALSWLARR